MARRPVPEKPAKPGPPLPKFTVKAEQYVEVRFPAALKRQTGYGTFTDDLVLRLSKDEAVTFSATLKEAAWELTN